MRRALAALLPKPVKSFVRNRWLNPIQRRVADYRLSQVIHQMRAADRIDRPLIDSIRRAWGNEGFSADAAYIEHMVEHVVSCKGQILECGSGVTTVVLGVLAEKHNLSVWSLEQDAEWTDFVVRRLRANNLSAVRVAHAPLQVRNGYVWYDIKLLELPLSFDLVLCDGPAVAEHWGVPGAQWRFGVLPSLSERGILVRKILLDDATEPRAANLLRRWNDEFGMVHRMLNTKEGDIAVVTPAA